MLRRFRFFVAFFAIWLVPDAHAAISPDRAAILNIERDMAAAQTVDQLLVKWDENAVLYAMATSGPKIAEYRGLDAIRAGLEPKFAAVSDIRIKFLQMVVKTDGKVAFAYSINRLKAKGRGVKRDLDFVFRESDCFVKGNEGWRLLHEDLSVPFDPNTNKAVFQSR